MDEATIYFMCRRPGVRESKHDKTTRHYFNIYAYVSRLYYIGDCFQDGPR